MLYVTLTLTIITMFVSVFTLFKIDRLVENLQEILDQIAREKHDEHHHSDKLGFNLEKRLEELQSARFSNLQSSVRNHGRKS